MRNSLCRHFYTSGIRQSYTQVGVCSSTRRDRALTGSAREFEDIPSTQGLPWLGNLVEMHRPANVEFVHLYYRSIINNLGDIVRLRIPGKGNDVLLLANPDYFKEVLSRDGQTPVSFFTDNLAYVRKHDLRHRYKSVGLLTQGQEWLNFRQGVQQMMMRPKSALYYINDINSVADIVEELVARNRSECGSLEDILALSKRFALESIALIFLGKRFKVLEGDPDGENLLMNNTKLFEAMMGSLHLPTWLFRMSKYKRMMVTASEEILDVCEKSIEDALTEVADDSVLSKLVRKCGKEKAVVMAQDALIAGSDTTGSSIAFLLYNVASNADVQEKLYREIQTVLGAEPLTERSLAQMKYLKACVEESLRRSPIAIGTARTTTVPMVLGGYKIPVGTHALLNVFEVATSANYFDQPDRWLRDGAERSRIHPFAHISFSHGARSCVGQRFARLEMQVLLYRLVNRFRMV